MRPSTSSPSPATSRPPRLEPHDRLTREEFERRYEAMPELKKAELLRGIVYIPSPVTLKRHGEPQLVLVGCLGWYKLATPGLRGGDNSTVRLGPESEPQPDILLLIPPERGGQARIDEQGYVTGAPELAAEIAASSASYDLHVKLEVYREHGVREYLVWRVDDGEVDWFALRDGRYEKLEAGPDGVLRSEVFPGLWQDAEALVSGDSGRLVAVLQAGIASPEHAEFVRRLASAS